MNDPVQYVYSSLYNHLDTHTFTGKCSLLDVLNNTNDSTLIECKQILYNFYSKYFDKLEDISFCLHVVILNNKLKTTYIKNLKIKGEIKDDEIQKLVKADETLLDVFVASVERDNCSSIFKYYEKVFNPHNLDKQLLTPNLEKTTPSPNKNIRSNTEPVSIVKTEVKPEDVNEKDSFSLIGRSQTEVKKESSSKDSSVNNTSDTNPKKEWSAPKAKQRGLDSMFKRKSAKPSVSPTPTVIKKEENNTVSKEKKLEDRFQFTTKTLIDKRREDESKKEEERMKIIKERLNNMSKASTPVSVKRERSEEAIKPEPKKVKTEEKPMDDIFNSDSDYIEEDDIKPLSQKNDNLKVSVMDASEPKENNISISKSSEPKDNNISISMASDSTGFIDLVLNNDKKGKKPKPAMVLESDSQDSSDDA